MGRRWKKYIASLTLCQRFSTGKFLAMWNAVFREEVDLGWVAAFGEVLTLSSQAVGRMMAEAIKRQWRTKSVLQYRQLKLSTKKTETVEKCLQFRGAGCDLAKCELSTPHNTFNDTIRCDTACQRIQQNAISDLGSSEQQEQIMLRTSSTIINAMQSTSC